MNERPAESSIVHYCQIPWFRDGNRPDFMVSGWNLTGFYGFGKEMSTFHGFRKEYNRIPWSRDDVKLV